MLRIDKGWVYFVRQYWHLAAVSLSLACGFGVLLHMTVNGTLLADDRFVMDYGEKSGVVAILSIPSINISAPIFEIGSLDQVDMILDRMVERTYKRNGEGGLFPLRGPKCCGDVLIEEGVYPLRDQRGVEIWYQMCDWMLENYMEK